MPGMKPRMVRAMLISRSTPHPFSASTPNGGRMTAKMILQMSLQVKGIFSFNRVRALEDV